MRKLLVKHFALDYRFKLFGVERNAPRASRIIFPLMAITGYFSVTNPDYPNPTFFIWFLYLLLLLSLFFGFVYFRFYPVKWEELDNFQKYQYGIFNLEKLSIKEYREWVRIYESLEE